MVSSTAPPWPNWPPRRWCSWPPPPWPRCQLSRLTATTITATFGSWAADRAMTGAPAMAGAPAITGAGPYLAACSAHPSFVRPRFCRHRLACPPGPGEGHLPQRPCPPFLALSPGRGGPVVHHRGRPGRRGGRAQRRCPFVRPAPPGAGQRGRAGVAPLLAELARRSWLAGNWRAIVRSALFCCPMLVTNLMAPHRPEPVRLLGLARAVAAGSEPVSGSDEVSRFLDGVTP